VFAAKGEQGADDDIVRLILDGTVVRVLSGDIINCPPGDTKN